MRRRVGRVKLESVAEAQQYECSAPIERGSSHNRSMGIGRAASAQAERRWPTGHVAALGDQESQGQAGKPSHGESGEHSRLAGSAHGASSMAINNGPSRERPEGGENGRGTRCASGALLNRCVGRPGAVVVAQRPPQRGPMAFRQATVDQIARWGPNRSTSVAYA